MNQYQPVFSHYEIFLQLRAHDWNNKLVKTRIQYLAEILFFQQPISFPNNRILNPNLGNQNAINLKQTVLNEREREADSQKYFE